MNPTPEQIAAAALVELGQTVGDDPIRQLNAYAHQLSELVQDMRERRSVASIITRQHKDSCTRNA